MRALAVVFTALFVPAYFGTAQLTVMPRGGARECLPVRARPSGLGGDAGGARFSRSAGAELSEFVGPQTESEPNLLRTDQFRGRPLGPADVSAGPR